MDTTEPGVTGLGPLGGSHLSIRHDGDTAGSERLLDEPGGEGLRGRQETGATHQHGDVTAQGGHPCGGLTGDDPAADDDETLRDLLHAGGVTRVPGLEALERSGHDGLRASGENDGAAGVEDPLSLSGSHGDAPFAVEACPSANDVETGTLGPAHLTSVVVVGNPLVTTLEQIERGQLGRAQAAEVGGRRRDLDRHEERLAGHAGVVGALATQELALDENRGQVGALDGVLGDVLPRRPATDHDDIVGAGLLRHCFLAHATDAATHLGRLTNLYGMSSLRPTAAE